MTSLSTWFSERPEWVQFATKEILTRGALSQADISKLCDLCIKEARGVKGFLPKLNLTELHHNEDVDVIRISSIHSIAGINALAPLEPLELDQGNITVVFGLNGSGKSGYVRILKHCCGARVPGNLLGNVYSSAGTSQEATIEYVKNGKPESVRWNGQGLHEDLTKVEIFDTLFGRVFSSAEDVVCYEPPVLALFSSLIQVCDEVAGQLDLEVAKIPSKLQRIPTEYENTTSGNWYKGISSATTEAELDRLCLFGDQDEAEILELQERLREVSPAEKARRCRDINAHQVGLLDLIVGTWNKLSDEKFKEITRLKVEVNNKRSAVDKFAATLTGECELDGIGSTVWKELWCAARKYSVEFAYPETEFPYVEQDALCVLCHQPLSSEAKSRLNRFESFVQGELENALALSVQTLEAARKECEYVLVLDSVNTKIGAADLADTTLVNEIIGLLREFEERSKLMTGSEIGESASMRPPLPGFVEELKQRAASNMALAEKYETDAASDNRGELTSRLSELLAKKWIVGRRDAILEEISRLKHFNLLSNARKSTNTTGLSRKKGELAEQLITEAFAQRFNDELLKLGAHRLRVQMVKSKTERGRVLHRLQLTGAAAKGIGEVLSEGEQRVVSIAAFLADVTGRQDKCPLVFDDPISSLDHEFEEALVARLLELSAHRQIVVFTHRLSLLGVVRQLRTPVAKGFACITSVGSRTGQPRPFTVATSQLPSALNQLADQRFRAAKKALESGDMATCETLCDSMCRDFRILLERSIEEELMSGIVVRFQRAVHSSKLMSLKKIEERDLVFLDALMTKYSTYEHSQSPELPTIPPEPKEILNDVNQLQTWLASFRKRSK